MADLDVVVVGAGFAGIYAVHALRSAGLTARAFEAGSGIGGTWFWNRYPGARCDVESRDYSYSFSPELEQEWSWSERYPAQPEVLRYLHHVADRFELWPYIQLNTQVTAAEWDAGRAEWIVTTGDGGQVTARFCVMAVGCLSAYQVPSLPGLETFAGPWYHTSRWPAYRPAGPAGWGRMFLRDFVGKLIVGILASIIPFVGWIIAGSWLLWDKDRQELWDKIAGTVVVNDPQKRLVP